MILRMWPVLVALACALALTVAACGPRGSGAPSGEEALPEGAIVIGGVGPLSQPGAVQAGLDMQWAMQAAVDDINAEGGVLGRQVALDFEDTQNQPDVAATVAKKLVEQSKVVGIAGEYHSGAALAQIPIYRQAGIPVIFAETYADSITAGDPRDPSLPPRPETVFRISPTSSMAMDQLIDWLTEGRQARKVVQLYEASDFGLGQRDALARGLQGTGVAVSQVQVALNQPDYSAVLNRVKQQDGDADVVIFDVTGETSYVIEQNAFDAGLVNERTTCVANQVASDSAAYWRAVPSGVGCVFRVVGPPPSEYGELARSLDERYRQRFGSPPKAWVFESYDAVRLIADAVERAGSTDGAAVTRALEQASFEGTLGQLSFPYGSQRPVPSNEPPWMWHQWTDPPLRLVQYTEKGQQLADATTVWPPAPG